MLGAVVLVAPRMMFVVVMVMVVVVVVTFPSTSTAFSCPGLGGRLGREDAVEAGVQEGQREDRKSVV